MNFGRFRQKGLDELPNREPKSKVLGACAHMTEGAAWTELNRILEPLNWNAGEPAKRAIDESPSMKRRRLSSHNFTTWTNPVGWSTLIPVGEAEAGSAGEQPAKE